LISGEGFFAGILSDGTAAIWHAKVEQNDEKLSLSWGVQEDVNQALLQYPAIGLGTVHLASGPHLACSLRGGTTYLLPLASESNAPTDAPVFLFPEKDDEEDDSKVLRYIHGFAAGNLVTNEGDTTLPVLVYVGEGGLMEVYACDIF
jgi:hypothetical protein